MAKRKFIDGRGVEREAINANASSAALRKFRVAMANRSMSKIQDAIDEALELWAANVTCPGETLASNGSTIRTGGLRTETINYGGIELQESELPWVQGLLTVLRGKNEDARNAIMTNIIAFTGYSARVPEVTGEGISIDALEARLAAIDQQILVETKTSDVGRSSVKPKARKRVSGKAGEK